MKSANRSPGAANFFALICAVNPANRHQSSKGTFLGKKRGAVNGTLIDSLACSQFRSGAVRCELASWWHRVVVSVRELVDSSTSDVLGRISGAAQSRFTSAIDDRLSPSRVSGGSPRIPDVKCAARFAFVVAHPSHPSLSPPRGFSHGVGTGHLSFARLRALLSLHQERIVAYGCDGGRSWQMKAAAAGSEPATAWKPVNGRRESIGGILREPKIVARAMREHPRAVADTLRRWRQ